MISILTWYACQPFTVPIYSVSHYFFKFYNFLPWGGITSIDWPPRDSLRGVWIDTGGKWLLLIKLLNLQDGSSIIRYRHLWIKRAAPAAAFLTLTSCLRHWIWQMLTFHVPCTSLWCLLGSVVGCRLLWKPTACWGSEFWGAEEQTTLLTPYTQHSLGKWMLSIWLPNMLLIDLHTYAHMEPPMGWSVPVL